MSVTSLVADTTNLDIDVVVAEGQRLWAALCEDDAYGTLVQECSLYNSNWTAPLGAMAVPGMDFAVHGEEYVTEGIKALVIYAAANGMVPLPTPVDAALHAATAQLDLCRGLAERIGLVPEHRTIQEATMPPYTNGCITDQLYTSIFGHKPPVFYWPDQATTDANFNLIAAHLAEVGIDIRNGGMSVDADAFERLQALIG